MRKEESEVTISSMVRKVAKEYARIEESELNRLIAKLQFHHPAFIGLNKIQAAVKMTRCSLLGDWVQIEYEKQVLLAYPEMAMWLRIEEFRPTRAYEQTLPTAL